MKNSTSNDLKEKFGKIKSILEDSILADTMKNTKEDSPWHRENSTWVHTMMVVEEFLARSPKVWTPAWFAGACAALFHDVGKPKCLTWKFKEGRGDYKAFYGHEKESARIFIDMVVRTPQLKEIFDYMGDNTLFITAWMIEHHLPWQIKDPKKRDALMKTCSRYLGGVEVFTTLLLSDTFGRISDDQDEKRLNAQIWVDEFHAEFSGKKDYFAFLNTEAYRIENDRTNRKIAFFMIGTSGSGKTTFRNQIIEAEGGKIGQFSLDDLRHELYGEDYGVAFQKSCQDKHFKAIAKERFVSSIRDNKCNVYIHDNTSRTKRSRAMDIIELQNRGYYVIAVLMVTSLKTALERQYTRSDKCVPDDAVTAQFFSVELPSIGEFDDIIIQYGE